MNRFYCMLACFIIASAFTSPAPAQDAALDAVDKQAATLEAELGKVLDTSARGSEVMIGLVDLYHQHGRVFGLIRIGQKFAAAHPNHPKHRDVMVKLLDGLAAMSRNDDIIAVARQFVTRYPKDANAGDMELLLAETLDQGNNRKAAADAWEAVWRRNPQAQKHAAARAVYLFTELNSTDAFKRAAALAKDVVDTMPRGEFAMHVGWQGVHVARRYGAWADSNAIALAMLRKNLPMDAQRLSGLHRAIAENYAQMGQRTNAVSHYEQARKHHDHAELHRAHISEMYNASLKGGQLEPVVSQYMEKYKDDYRGRDDRWNMFGLLAHAYARDGDKPHAAKLFEQMLPHDGESHNPAGHYIGLVGDTPEDYQRAERVLLDAIQKNPRHASRIRYALAFSLYRDRMKQPDKAKAVLRDLLRTDPFNDGHSWEAIRYLLYDAADDAAFEKDAELIIDATVRFANLGNFREYFPNWIKDARRHKEHRDRSEIAAQLWKARDDDQLYRNWVSATGNNRNAIEARDWLIQSDHAKRMTDDQLRWLLRSQGYYYQHYTNKNRDESVKYYATAAKRFPKDYEVAQWLLDAAVSHGTDKEAHAAARHLMSFDPPYNDADGWRRLLAAAVKAKDADLAKQALAYINKSQQQHGESGGGVADIGRNLDQLGLKDDALAYWRGHWHFDPSDWQSHEAVREVVQRLEGDAQIAFLKQAYQKDGGYHGAYASYIADIHFKVGDWAAFEQVQRDSRARQDERPYQNWGMGEHPAWNWMSAMRDTNSKADDATKRRVFTVIRDIRLGRVSAAAQLSLLEMEDGSARPPMRRLLAYRDAAVMAGDGSGAWDSLFPYAQAAMARRQHVDAATFATAMLHNISGVNDERQQSARAMVGQSYARMGAVGLAIDENSPVAPLLQAALYLRLGDQKLAFDTYNANRRLFDDHREQLPIELILFVADSHIAGGGEENFERAEDILRGWLVKFADSQTIDDSTKARVQLLLGKNYFSAKRYDVARSEFTSLMNRFPKTSEALEAEFGIGETFMAQKMYDEAEKIFEKLSNARQREVVVRAEFLRGVLAHRRGDRDEARDIFRSVLERVPDISLANMTLFNLSEVYGDEQRYIEQLELLNTVGRLGRNSKRWHTPGTMLSIVVQDSDLGISRGHTKIPVIVTTQPGGDQELIYLYSGGAGKGLFRGDVDTALGAIAKGDKVLQLTGNDVIKCDYPDEFKKEFRNIPLADAEIRIAADARFGVASSRIQDEQKETFSQTLAREAMENQQEQDQRVSQRRPQNQIKPGNLIYLRVKDADRDLSDEPDRVLIKLVASSGDQVQVELVETGAHSGIFEGTTKTGELPAGALASDNAIDHSPLMAIDKDAGTYWQSEPDGDTPKWLSVDMKDLKRVNHVSVSTPDAAKHAPIRAELQGSHDGRFWFRLASHPPAAVAEPLKTGFGPMTMRVYSSRDFDAQTWADLARMANNREPETTEQVEQLAWQRPADADERTSYVVIWQGKFVQPRPGAVRFAPSGGKTAVIVNGVVAMELAADNTAASVDVWLERGVHDLIVAAIVDRRSNVNQVTCLRARENPNLQQVTNAPFRASDYDLTHPDLKAAIDAGRVTDPAKPLVLASADAKLNKKTDNFGPYDKYEGDPLAYWQHMEDTASWTVSIDRPGPVAVWMNWSHDGDGSECIVTLTGRGDAAAQKIETKVANTRDWQRFVNEQVGTFRIEKPGQYTLTVTPKTIANGGLMDLRAVTLRPTDNATTISADGKWDFEFSPHDIRYVRLMVHEYSGEAVSVNHVEVRGPGSAEAGSNDSATYIPTEADVLALASNDTLEIAAGDQITASYTDEFVFSSTAQDDAARLRVLTQELAATYYNARINPIAYDLVRSGGGGVGAVRKDLMRIDPGERIIIEVVDYDMDATDQRDEIKVLVSVNDAPPIELTATETENYTGVFTKEVDTAAASGSDKVVVKKGDRVYIRYVDRQNTFPGHSITRESVVYVNEPTEGLARVIETRYIRPPLDEEGKPQGQPRAVYLPPSADPKAVAAVAFELPLTVEVIDPDQAKDSRSSIIVELTTTGGVTVPVQCVVSTAHAQTNAAFDDGDTRSWALREGRFVGQVIMQLGGKDSPQLVPLTTDMPTGVIGGALPIDENPDDENEPQPIPQGVARVLNLTGKDRVTAVYKDERRPDSTPVDLSSQARLVSNATLAVTDRDYDDLVTKLHVGEKIFIRVTDADADMSDDRDRITVTISTDRGESETVELEETLAHSGDFTGSFPLKAQEKPTAGNMQPQTPEIESFFGDTLSVKLIDHAASTETGVLELTAQVPIVVGTDGLVKAFSKVFGDETLAVETRFTIAESYFELFKSHKALERDAQMKTDLEAGRRVLREVMEDYPDPKYVPRIQYLLGQFAQELQQWDEAIEAYRVIVRQHPEHALAPDAQYKLAQSFEEAGNFDEALEAYVTLAATYPRSPLIAKVMVRINEYFWTHEQFIIAANVAEKFLEKFDGHEFAPKMAFRIGQAYYKAEQYARAADAFDVFSKDFPDDELASMAYFWAGESFRMANNVPEAFRRYNFCRWKHPESEAAKYARGRLALPEMLQQFEREAQLDDE